MMVMVWEWNGEGRYRWRGGQGRGCVFGSFLIRLAFVLPTSNVSLSYRIESNRGHLQ